MINQQILEALFDIAPQFRTEDPVELARLNRLIDLLKCTICPNDFGKCYILAFAYYLAHLLLINQNAASIGLASSLTEGGLSISYSSSASGPGGLDGTIYGKQFLALRGTGRTKMFVATENACYGGGYFYPHVGSGYPGGWCC